MMNSFIYTKYLKRIIDVFFSIGALIVLIPFIIIIAILIRIKLGSPVIFFQDRPGYQGKIFRLYKFRTMTDEKDEKGNLLPDNVRLTRFGKLLRSTSLDELPELWNILKGDMSIIGPRPLLIKYLPFYNHKQARRHDVKPGLTGYAQVNGRNTITWEQKFDYDVFYVDHLSFFFDLKIFFMTIKKVIRRDDIEFSEELINTEFMGTKIPEMASVHSTISDINDMRSDDILKE